MNDRAPVREASWATRRQALRLKPGLLACAAALFLCALSAPSVAQSAKSGLKPLDVFDLHWVSDPQISPDGRSIAYVRMAYDIKTDRPRGVIWLVGVDGKHARPLSGAMHGASPRWSPDGTRLA